jgi:DNA processing protein
MFDQEKLCQVALSLTPGVGDVLMRHLVAYCGSAAGVFATSLGKLQKIKGIGEGLSKVIVQKDAFHTAEATLKRAEAEGIQILFFTESEYPERLKRLYDAPTLLYFKGQGVLGATRTVSLVGTRQATDYGKRITEEIIEGIAAYKPLIVSGLAYGVDIAAHRAALKHHLPTVGVMASGIDVIYPSAHHKTAMQMLENGGLLTENPLGTGPDAPRFVARNRIIAGLSDAIVVVESAAKGGGLITAEYANNYHREVFAVPGDLKSKYSEGCNQLIRRNKAIIFTQPQDIVEALNWDISSKEGGAASPTPPDFSNFTDDESQVLSLLRQHGEMHVDDLSWQTQVPMNKLASLLLNLEFQGMVKTLPGKRYALG